MPGAASLRAQRYYAHPQNQFWRIFGEILGTAANVDYASRLQALTLSGIALWDVLDSCVRPGSLDSDIVSGSQQVNDFEAFFDAHPRVGRVLFNGSKADACFRKLVAPCLSQRKLVLVRLPSTSPAHASLPYSEKLAAWRAALGPS
jgi:double-stranded uracil-DNA glycosylase